LQENDFQDFIKKLRVDMPPEDEFNRLGDVTALFRNDQDEFVRLNYERGMLLYALIAKYKPKNVLEFGTASGYATLCMAWAMEENKIDGKIFTIDIEPMEKISEKITNWGNGPSIEFLSRKELWGRIAEKNWLNHIVSYPGYSVEIMYKETFPKIQFAYIDGAHFFEGVQHDFYSFLKIADNNFLALFDDYISRPSYGVKKFVDDEIEGYFDSILIHTDREKHLMKMTSNSKYGMILINSNIMKKSLSDFLFNKHLDKTINEYIKFEKRLKIRGKINQRIPFFKKIRFQYWKNNN